MKIFIGTDNLGSILRMTFIVITVSFIHGVDSCTHLINRVGQKLESTSPKETPALESPEKKWERAHKPLVEYKYKDYQ